MSTKSAELGGSRAAAALAAPPEARPLERPLGTVSIRELARNVSGVVAEVTRTGRPTVVTKHGVPVAAVVPMETGRLEDLVLSQASEYLENMAADDRRHGRTRSAGEVFGELRRLAEALAGAASPPTRKP